MKSLGSPDYVYTPWSEERRAAARARMKSIIEGQTPERKMRKLIDQVERHAYAHGYVDGLNAAVGALEGKIERHVKKPRRSSKREP